MKVETYCPLPAKHMFGDCFTHNERIVLTARERTTLSTAANLVEQARDTMRERLGERDWDAHPAFTLSVDGLLDGEADWMESELREETSNE